MNKLICDVCGGSIAVQSGGKYGICDCCGANYTLERMREITNGVKVSQTGTKEDIEQWKKLLQTYLNVFDWESAEKIVKKILEAIPTDEYALAIYQKLLILKDYVIKDGSLIAYKGISKDIVIPEGVKKIACALNGNINSITIPKSVQVIENFGFFRISNLKEIVIPDNVQIISKNAFEQDYNNRAYDKIPTIYLPKHFIEQEFVHYYTDFPSKPVVFYQKSDFVFYDRNETLENAKKRNEKEKQEETMTTHRIRGLCQYCGGVFTGVFNKKCSKCGEKKDY